MPTFPTYPGTLPKVLNPLNPYHYLLLVYWVFCRPSALQCYFDQANSEPYSNPHVNLRLRNPAYRNLWLMIPILSAFYSINMALLIHWLYGTRIDWLGLAVVVPLGTIVGLGFGGKGGVTIGVAFSIALGLVFSGASGAIISVTFGMAVSAAYSERHSVASGLGISMAVITTIIFLEFTVAGRAMFSLGLLFSLGLFRVPLYLAYLLPALLSRFGAMHPVDWDELNILPLPATRAFLVRQLHQNENAGFALLARIARNPFQRWAVQSALKTYLQQHPQPIHLLYRLLTAPPFQEHIKRPLDDYQKYRNPPVSYVLLTELHNRRLEKSLQSSEIDTEKIVYFLTGPFRDRQTTPLTEFAGMLYDLLSQAASIDIDRSFELRRWRSVYTGVQNYPGGADIARTFTWIERFLSYRNLPELTKAINITTDKIILQIDLVRPAVWAMLTRFSTVGNAVKVYRAATGHTNRQAALRQLTDTLKDIKSEISTNITVPEQALLRRIVRQWQALITAEADTLGKSTDRRTINQIQHWLRGWLR